MKLTNTGKKAKIYNLQILFQFYLDEILDFTELFETISENLFLEWLFRVLLQSSDASDESSPKIYFQCHIEFLYNRKMYIVCPL